MLPGAGLYLPESLHRKDLYASKQPDATEESSKQFSPGVGRTSQGTSSSASTSAIDQNGLSSVAGDMFTNTSTIFDYADYVFTLSKRSAEAELFATLIRRVRQDLAEASQLYLSPTITSFLEAWPDRKAWIDSVLLQIRKDLTGMGNYIESARISRNEDPKLAMQLKFAYTLNRQKRLSAKQQDLTLSHQNLLGAIQVMQTVKQCAGLGEIAHDPIFEAPLPPWLQSDSNLSQSPHSQRSNSMNLSMSSVMDFESRNKTSGELLPY